jgi:hypothetical protein
MTGILRNQNTESGLQNGCSIIFEMNIVVNQIDKQAIFYFSKSEFCNVFFSTFALLKKEVL